MSKELILEKIEEEIELAEFMHDCKIKLRAIRQLKELCLSALKIIDGINFNILIAKQENCDTYFIVPLIAYCSFSGLSLNFQLIGVKNAYTIK